MEVQPNLADYFRWRCIKGLKARGFGDNSQYVERLNYEVELITRLGFCGYLLLVADYVRWAREQGIPCGPGRGSCAGSLCVYCLEITQIDPIKFGLFIERFINPHRISPPDCDLDFCQFRRDEVISYVTSKYGAHRVARIGTFGTMKSKGAIRDVGRALGLPFEEVNHLASLTLAPVAGRPPKLKECFEKVPELKAIRDSNTPAGEVLKLAERAEGNIRSFGTHAAGIVISDGPLSDLVPLALDKDGQTVSQLDMHGLEDLGLIKFDFLGLTTLSVIAKAIELVKEHKQVTLDINSIPLDDETVYSRLRTGDTVGIFQLETSAGIRDLLVQIAPRNIEDLAALLSIYRPGPMASAQMQTYLRVRAGKEKPKYLVPELESILAPTNGFMIYQEQAMAIAQKLAGYTAPEADSLRHAVGKKSPEEMKKHEAKFIQGAVSGGYNRAVADELYSDIRAFADYSFCRAHAISYCVITYQTAFLKAHYPTEFMCAALECNKDNEDQVVKYIAECRRLGIKVLPPDINQSYKGFSIQGDGAIRFGISAIKNLGDSPVEHVIEIRGGVPFKDIYDFSARVDLTKVNKKKLESLVLSGAFDYSGTTRASLLKSIEKVLEYKEERKRYETKLETHKRRLQKHLDREREILIETIAGRPTKLKPIKRPELPLEPATPVSNEQLPEMPSNEILAHERELLGFFVSGHPLEGISHTSKGAISIEKARELDHGSRVRLLVVPATLKEFTTKSKKQKMAFVTLEDLTGQIEGVVFSRLYSLMGHLLGAPLPLLVDGIVEHVEAEDSRTTKLRIEQIVSVSPTVQPATPSLLAIPLSLEGEPLLKSLQPGTEIHFLTKTPSAYLLKARYNGVQEEPS